VTVLLCTFANSTQEKSWQGDKKMVPIQCKLARTASGLGIREIAAAAKLSPDTISRFERGEELKPRTIEAIRAAFERAGVVFIDSNGGGPGVRLKRKPKR
jgi:transcriptional regulator with XRE-family HTH domain